MLKPSTQSGQRALVALWPGDRLEVVGRVLREEREVDRVLIFFFQINKKMFKLESLALFFTTQFLFCSNRKIKVPKFIQSVVHL